MTEEKYTFRGIIIPLLIASIIFQSLANMILSNNVYFAQLPNPDNFFNWNYDLSIALTKLGGEWVWTIPFLNAKLSFVWIQVPIQYFVAFLLLVLSPLIFLTLTVYYQFYVISYAVGILPFPFNGIYISIISMAIVVSIVTGIEFLSSRFGH